MSEQNMNGGQAFPCLEMGGNGLELTDGGMTLRQYAAIKLKVPSSGTDWLDEMIRESQRNEIAASALKGPPAELSAHSWHDLPEVAQRLVQQGWQPTDDELTAIYKKANGEVGKPQPLTTQRIFRAMRAMLNAAPQPPQRKPMTLPKGSCASEWGGRETGPCLYTSEQVLEILAAHAKGDA